MPFQVSRGLFSRLRSLKTIFESSLGETCESDSRNLSILSSIFRIASSIMFSISVMLRISVCFLNLSVKFPGNSLRTSCKIFACCTLLIASIKLNSSAANFTESSAAFLHSLLSASKFLSFSSNCHDPGCNFDGGNVSIDRRSLFFASNRDFHWPITKSGLNFLTSRG